MRPKHHTATHPYFGRVAVLATKHGKERQIARPLKAAIGLQVHVPDTIDTDILGTFTGEVPRHGTPMQVVVQKARLGMKLSGLLLGLANEGSFGPHPALPIVVDTEIVVFVDDERGIQVSESGMSERVVAAQHQARSLDDLTNFLERVHFPSHGLIVRPVAPISTLAPQQIIKGITDVETLQQAITQSVSGSPEALAHIETDLRAHMNPTRRRVIRHTATMLARRLAHCCPHCDTPGWGHVESIRGLPCEWCGEPTILVREEVLGCPLCDYKEHVPRPDGRVAAPAGQCAYCNP